MKLQVRAAALRDLDGIYDYTVAAHGVAQAEAYVRGLWAAMENLCAYPKSGPASECGFQAPISGGRAAGLFVDLVNCHRNSGCISFATSAKPRLPT